MRKQTGIFSSKIDRRQTIIGAGAMALASVGYRTAFAEPSRAMRLGVSPASDNDAEAHVAALMLREKYNYKVEVIPMTKAVEYAALGEGKIDVIVDCYLEGDGPWKGIFKGGHSSFVEKIKDKIEVLGKTEGPMDQGFVVPAYVDCKTMEDLAKNRDKFGNKILGGDPAWGLSVAADRANKAYDLKFDLVLSSEDAMVAALKRAYLRKEWICITGWRVHPMWAEFELKYIEDPKKVFGAEPLWHYAIATKGFGDTFPEAKKFLLKYHIPNEELSKLMLWLTSGGMKSEEAAAKWVKETRGKGIIEKWFE